MYLPGNAGGVLRVLWLLAGAAMLALILFLTVLLVAGIGFRLARQQRPSQRRSRIIFASAGLVALVLPASVFIPISPFHSLAFAGEGCPPPTPQAATSKGGTVTPMAIRPRTAPDGILGGNGLAGTQGRTLLLYDRDQTPQEETSVLQLANLVSHFGSWTAEPVTSYRSQQVAEFDATIYLGGHTNLAPSDVFLDDVMKTTIPVLWIGENVERLRASNPDLWSRRLGFGSVGNEPDTVTRVDYKGEGLNRMSVDSTRLMRLEVTDPARVTVLATAALSDGTTLPWAVRSGVLTYVAENPFLNVGEKDRYLAFSDLLFDALSPATLPRHRALVRLEDVGPFSDPRMLKKVADYLYSQHIPFAFGVYPVYKDPKGAEHRGTETTVRLADRPQVVEALKYMCAHNGTPVMHGYTHQLEARANPDDAVSGRDFEFYLAHRDSAGSVQLDGAVPGDSTQWAIRRIDQSAKEFNSSGLSTPRMFEFPHYGASAQDYAAVAERLPYRYERSLYFPGLLSGHPPDDSGRTYQFFPYAVRDVYGSEVIPENAGYFVPGGQAGNSGGVTDILESARANLVVRDGVASFFYHPYLGVGELPRIINGILQLGYTFVAPDKLVSSP
jgi:uncharacterized protein YdaL